MADKLKLDRTAMRDRNTAHLRIFVGGLTEQANTDNVYEYFEQYGQINGIIINRGFGFVQFETETSAQNAIANSNGAMFLNKRIDVKIAMSNDAPKRDNKESVQGDATAPPQTSTPNVQENVLPQTDDAVPDEPYDKFGNYIGDQQNEPKFESENFNDNDNYNEGRGGMRGRGDWGKTRMRRRGGRSMTSGFRDRSPPPPRGDWGGGGFDRFPQPLPDYNRPIPVTERNDCEIIVVSKTLTDYAEYIEGRLKRLGIVVDLLFPMEDVTIGKVLGNIASRGCLYAILVMPQNQEHKSLTLTILHGLPQEHRNMPLEDALQLLSRNFQEVQRGGRGGREAVYALLGQLADGRTLTALQYDKVIEYLKERKEQQVKVELGEPLLSTQSGKTQVDLQERIMSILKDKEIVKETHSAPPPPAQNPSQPKLLNDPTVRKALNSILQKFT